MSVVTSYLMKGTQTIVSSIRPRHHRIGYNNVQALDCGARSHGVPTGMVEVDEDCALKWRSSCIMCRPVLRDCARPVLV